MSPKHDKCISDLKEQQHVGTMITKYAPASDSQHVGVVVH